MLELENTERQPMFELENPEMQAILTNFIHLKVNILLL